MTGPVETTPYAACIYRTELEARRAAPEYEHVDYVAFGVDVPEALR